MNFIVNVNNFNTNHLHFLEPKNNIIMDGSFTKTYYSNENFILNGIFLNFEIKPTEINKISYYNERNDYDRNDKYIMYFDLNENIEVCKKVIDIEKSILDYYMKYRCISGDNSKIPDFSLKNHIINKNLKFYKNVNCNMNKFYLKISGIWENHRYFGITYKIVEYKSTVLM